MKSDNQKNYPHYDAKNYFSVGGSTTTSDIHKTDLGWIAGTADCAFVVLSIIVILCLLHKNGKCTTLLSKKH